MSSGERTATFRRGSAEALLRSYLIFVRDLRGQRREPSIELRADDVAVLASHLGVSQEIVLGGLLDLMGATRAQRSTMLAMLAAGALSVVLSGSIVTGLSDDGVSVEFERLADAVHAAVNGSDDASTGSAPAATEPGEQPAAPSTASTAGAVHGQEVRAQPVAERRSVVGPATEDVGTDASDRVLAAGSASDDTPTTPSPYVLRSAAAATSTTTAAVAAAVTSASVDAAGVVAGEPADIGVAPDGSLVASVAPPVPATAPEEPVATGQLPDGTTVGVTAPPVPPPTDEPVATAELPDGTTVGVAAPPVPPSLD